MRSRWIGVGIVSGFFAVVPACDETVDDEAARAQERAGTGASEEPAPGTEGDQPAPELDAFNPSTDASELVDATDPETVQRIGNIQLSADPQVLQTIIGTKPDLDLTFTNQDGEEVNLSEYGDKALVITTIYTSCPVADMCPRLTDEIAWLSRQVPRDLKDDIQFVLVSFDPQRDTPEVLKSYGQRHGINFETTDLLRGDIDQTRSLIQDALQLSLSVDPMTNTIVTHQMMYHVINPEGYIVVERTAESGDAIEMLEKEMARAATMEFVPPTDPTATDDNEAPTG